MSVCGLSRRVACLINKHKGCFIYRTRQRTLTSSSIRASSNIVTSSAPNVEQPTGNVLNTIFENVNKWGSKTAVECPATGHSYTYNQLLEGIARWAGFLTSVGITKGDIIAIYMPNCAEYPVILLGAMSIGVVATTINNNYTAEEVARQLKDSGAKLLVGVPSLQDNINRALKMYEYPINLIMNGPSNISGIPNLQDIVQNPDIPYADIVDVSLHDLAAMPYSSGTTGLPKGVSVSHGAFSSNIKMVSHPSFFATTPSTDDYQGAYIGLLPIFHIYGMLVKLMIGLHAGVKFIPVSSFEPNSYLRMLEANKIETLHLVPPMLTFLINSPAATPKTLKSVNSIIIGAAPVSPSAAEAFQKKFKKDIFFQEGYGMTEVLITNIVPLHEKRIGTCGKLLPNVSAKIIDTFTGEELPPTQTGEICLKTPSMMNGYFRNEGATSSTIDKDGWLHSGDVGCFDEEGYMKIVDRTKELVKVKGLQVSPSELEDHIRQHPDVLDVGVVGVPNDRLGEAPRAYIVTKTKISSDDINRFLDGKIAKHKELAGGVVFIDALPKTATGKLLRRELKKIGEKK